MARKQPADQPPSVDNRSIMLAVRKSLDANATTLRQRWSELVSAHQGEWVAITDGEIISVD